MSESNATEILSGLWIGNQTAVNDQGFVESKQIEMIIDCDEKELMSQSDVFKGKYLLSMSQLMRLGHAQRICQQLNEFVDLIKVNINTYNILIYCRTGDQYAPILLIMYLLKYSGLDLESIYKCIQSKKVNICDHMTDSHVQLFECYQKLLAH
jgi:hypothetical protein